MMDPSRWSLANDDEFDLNSTTKSSNMEEITKGSTIDFISITLSLIAIILNIYPLIWWWNFRFKCTNDGGNRRVRNPSTDEIWLRTHSLMANVFRGNLLVLITILVIGFKNQFFIQSRWYDSISCKMMICIEMISSLMTGAMVAIISVDKCQAMNRNSHGTSSIANLLQVRLFGLITWILSVVAVIPVWIGTGRIPDTEIGTIQCQISLNLGTSITAIHLFLILCYLFLFYIGPTMIATICLARIFNHICRHHRRHGGDLQKRIRRSDRRTVHMVTGVTLAFITGWLPFYFSRIYHAIKNQTEMEIIPDIIKIWPFTNHLLIVMIGTMPLVYTISNPYTCSKFNDSIRGRLSSTSSAQLSFTNQHHHHHQQHHHRHHHHHRDQSVANNNNTKDIEPPKSNET